jgi:cell division protein FtsI (penicillin-binding protein 3)
VVAQLRRGNEVLPSEGVLTPVEPRNVIRPETAATLRKLMEGVILKGGTGPRARLDGWTAAGKTGTAQKIDPNTGRYSPTNLIASFTGFAPINEPAVAILVSLDSPVGPREGGQVAAPVFKRVAEQVLAYLDVPRDLPVNPKLVQAEFKQGDAAEESSLEDFTATDFSAQPDDVAEEAPSAKSGKVAKADANIRIPAAGAGIATNNSKSAELPPAVTVSVDEGGDVTVPDFSGKTMRDVSEQCLRLGLNPVLVGTSLATGQTPAAGAKVKHGAKVTVEFGTMEIKSDKRARTQK